MSKLEIRAHHGLCTLFFEEKGYSDGFTSNMALVISELRKNPFVRIIKKTDLICSKCPNNQDGICTEQEKVCRYDNAVFELCGIEPETEIRWADFQKAVLDKIINRQKFSAVCIDCSWSEICHKKVQKK